MYSRKRLTQEEFVDKIAKINSNIEVIGEYVNSMKRVRVRCKVCGHEWEPIACSLLYVKSGCPACHFKKLHAMTNSKKMLTKEQFVEKLAKAHPDIKLVGGYVSLSERANFKCKTCGREWSAIASTVLKSEYGCRKCAHKIMAEKCRQNCRDTFVDRMATILPDVEILSEYTLSNEKVRVRCKVCGHEWGATPNNLLRGRGCPVCYKAKKKYKKIKVNPNKILANFLRKLEEKNLGVTLVSEYKGHIKPLVVRCNDCGCEYITTADNLFNGHGLCPICKNTRQGRRSKIVSVAPQKQEHVIIVKNDTLLDVMNDFEVFAR